MKNINTFSKLHDHMIESLEPLSTFHDYSLNSSITEFRKLQEQMALVLKPISPLHDYVSSFSKLHDHMIESSKSFSIFRDYALDALS